MPSLRSSTIAALRGSARGRLDRKADGFEPEYELPHVLPHLAAAVRLTISLPAWPRRSRRLMIQLGRQPSWFACPSSYGDGEKCFGGLSAVLTSGHSVWSPATSTNADPLPAGRGSRSRRSGHE